MQSNKEYLRHHGLLCPVCGGGPVHMTGPIRFLHPDAWNRDHVASMSCDVCGATWEDVYELVGYQCVFDGQGNRLT